MATKKQTTSSRKRTAKGSKTLAEQVGELIRDVEAEMVVVRDQWNRYHHEGVKKGFKEARKAVLRVKKGTVELRRVMSDISI